MQEDTVFTKIIKGQIPCHKVYEDSRVLAFLTIGPIRDGHVLVIPKKQVDSLWDLEDEDYQAVMAASRKVARKVQEVFRPVRVGVHVAGLEVPHAHVHIFPFDTEEDFWQKPGSANNNSEHLALIADKLRLSDDV